MALLVACLAGTSGYTPALQHVGRAAAQRLRVSAVLPRMVSMDDTEQVVADTRAAKKQWEEVLRQKNEIISDGATQIRR